ncbi:MAG: DUF882 domain-containing protein [Gemmatimonadales bacterium]
MLSSNNPTSRRAFLATGLATLPVIAGLPRGLLAMAAPSASTSRALDFLHTHTGEKLAVEYFVGGRYLPDALSDVNHYLRDIRTGDVHPIDPKLLDILYALKDLTGTSRPFQVISGYRSARTNAMLRQHGGGGIASGSLHMQGKAIDIRLADVPLRKLRDAALNLGRGGVGYYPGAASNFVHVDTGRVRRW